MTKERVEIRQYLLDRFYQASGQNANASDRTILCTTLYERFNCGQDRIVKKRLRDFVEAVLKHWTRCLAKCGIGLEKYEVRKKAGQIEAFIITVGKN
jgi:hypothetical protein